MQALKQEVNKGMAISLVEQQTEVERIQKAYTDAIRIS